VKLVFVSSLQAGGRNERSEGEKEEEEKDKD
jgi:hypothetical protein